MTPQTFIIQQLKELLNEIPGIIGIRYGISAYTGSHIIEIYPEETYYNNDDYIKKEIAVTEQFEKLFPGEELFFITGDGLSKVENPIFESFVQTIDNLFVEKNTGWYDNYKQDIIVSTENYNYGYAA